MEYKHLIFHKDSVNRFKKLAKKFKKGNIEMFNFMLNVIERLIEKKKSKNQ